MGFDGEATDFCDRVKQRLAQRYSTDIEQADKRQLYFASAEAVRGILEENYRKFRSEAEEQGAKRVCYLSMEFLPGKSLRNNLFNLGLLERATALYEQCGYSFEDVAGVECDAGLGNGGLGRLAACYLDAMATARMWGEGFSVLYEYGFFRQYFEDGEQKELPDTWLESGRPWLRENTDRQIHVRFGGRISEDEKGIRHEGYCQVKAAEYDMYIPGYRSGGVSVLRLWRALPSDRVDMEHLLSGDFDEVIRKRGHAELLSLFLYPPDNTGEGKKLRLAQQYFFVSATVQTVVSEHYRRQRTVMDLSDKVVFHINDTHPALCIPELLRVLCDDYGLDFDSAWEITRGCVSYTNHTVMPEALEVWDEDLYRKLLPRIYHITKEINRRFSTELYSVTPGEWERLSEISVVSYGKIRMANLAVIGASHVNGVSALHSRLVRNRLFPDLAARDPDKFLNVTNGISYRRWLCQANPRLCAVIDDVIGDGYRKHPYELKDLERFSGDREVCDRVGRARQENKRAFSDFAGRLTGTYPDPDSLFDVQIKRLHEYKRQLLNCLKILAYYDELTSNPDADISPKTFIFAAKAAPGYAHAKRVILLINRMARMIGDDPMTRDVLRVIFLPDYNVSTAERLIPASDLSEQISLAGKEASGTGNMKFMLNGALTLGTYDGANIEISGLVGEENRYIFGMREEEAEKRQMTGYRPDKLLRDNPRLSSVIARLRAGIAGEDFSDIAEYLTAGDAPDPYMCLSDFDAYMEAYHTACLDYKNRRRFYGKGIVNIANAGFFASDRAISEYADKIWSAQKVKDKKRV